jgi:hypothetical protein
MDRAAIEPLAARAPLAEGYRFELLERGDVGALVDFIATWFPAVSVGGASGYLREQFYAEQVYFEGGPQRDVLVMLLKHGDEMAGVFSCEVDRETLSLYAGIGVVANEHRGAHLAPAGIVFCEALGRQLGLGLAYGMATLKSPHAQRAFEQAGWQLIGITPGYDRELVAPGVVKRVFEAVYAKVLVPDAELLQPQLQHMTTGTQAFFQMLYPDAALPRASEVDSFAPKLPRRTGRTGLIDGVASCA